MYCIVPGPGGLQPRLQADLSLIVVPPPPAVPGPGGLQLPPLHARPHGGQRLGLCLPLPADRLLLVPAAGLRRAARALPQGDPTGAAQLLTSIKREGDGGWVGRWEGGGINEWIQMTRV